MNYNLSILENQKEFNLEKLEDIVMKRIISGDFGYNPGKTKRGIFLKSLVSDSMGMHMNAELARIYGLISADDLSNYYKMPSLKQEAYREKYELKTRQLEEYFANELSKKTTLNGKFFFGWEDAGCEDCNEMFYGLYYSEDISPVNN